MTMVRYNMRTDSGGLLLMYNGYNYIDFNIVSNIGKLRLFLRRYVLTMPNIVDIMADCMNKHFPENKISTENGIQWCIGIPNENAEDLDLYRTQLHQTLLDFFNNDIVKESIKLHIKEEDKNAFYDLFYKFRTLDISPNVLVEFFAVPEYDKGTHILTIIF